MSVFDSSSLSSKLPARKTLLLVTQAYHFRSTGSACERSWKEGHVYYGVELTLYSGSIWKSSGDVWNVYSKVQRILGRHAFACLTNQPLFMTMYDKFLSVHLLPALVLTHP